MVALAKQLNNDPDTNKFAQIFIQQPRNAVRITPGVDDKATHFDSSPIVSRFLTAKSNHKTKSSPATSIVNSQAPSSLNSAARPSFLLVSQLSTLQARAQL